MRSLVFIIVLLICSVANAEPWAFTWENDFPVPRGLDRNYTNGFKIKRGNWALANEMYTPRDKKNPLPPEGDRPWDGYSYIEYEDKTLVTLGEAITINFRFGAVGEASGTEALQKFVHDDLGAGQHPTWAGQNPSEPTIDIVVAKKNREYLKSIIGDSALEQEYGVQFGNVKDLIYLDQKLKKHFFKYFYPYVGLRGDAVAYNTHLDGRLFQSNDYTIDKNWFVASARAGFELYFPNSDFYIDYHYEYKTEEFSDQVGRHTFGSLTFGFKF